MKKSYVLLLSSLLIGSLITSCQGGGNNPTNETNNNEEQNPQDKPNTGENENPGENQNPGGNENPGENQNPDVTHPEDEEEYVIKVTVPSQIRYTVSHQKAKKGETITFTITSIDEGYTVKTVSLNGKVINGENNVYTFVMPNQSAIITVALNATGDVTIFGDIAAVLNKEGDIYVARNVKVATNGRAYFSYKVRTQNNEETILESFDLDENKCFADVTFATGRSEELSIASNCTYDFYYDPSAQYPCYVRRVSVDYLPSDENGLYSLFDGSYRSESTVNYPGLNKITYKTTDRTDTNNTKKYNFEYNLFENNVSFAKVVDILNDDKEYYVYKAYDEANNLYEVVDTYTFGHGNNDRTRGDYNLRGQYAARFDVVPLESDDNGRREISKRSAMHMVNYAAHYGRYLESEIQDAYRVGFTADELSKSDLLIESTKEGEEITTSIKSFKEFNSTAGAYTVEMHEAYIYDVTLKFDVAGKIKSVNYLETKYAKNEWDFQGHKPGVGQEGITNKKLEVTYEYGAPLEGAPEFDKSKYFVNSLDNIQFYSDQTGVEDDGVTSRLHYADKVYIGKRDANDKHETLKKFEYSPATALDTWQYGPVASSDPNIVGHLATDYFDQMTCNSVGTASVTFGNFTKNSGVKKNVDITVHATQKFHSIYIYSTWGGYAGDTIDSQTAQVVAGQETSFKIGVTPSTAPVIYDATSSNPKLLTIKSTGEKLTVDTTGAANITTATDVSVTITSDWFQDWITDKKKVFTFRIIPQAANPTGTTWGLEGATNDAKIYFTNDDYTGTISQYYADEYAGAKIGKITDNGSGDYAELDVDFYYVYKKGQIKARLFRINKAQDSYGALSKSPSDYDFEFYYDAATDRIGVGLAVREYDADIEDYYTYALYGEYDDNLFISYTPFVRL